MMTAYRLLTLALLLATASGCLRRDFVDERAGNEAPPPARPPAPNRSPELEREVAQLRTEVAAREAKLQHASVGEAELSRRVDELSAVNGEMNERLRVSAQSVEQLAAERARLLAALAQAQAGGEQQDGATPPPPPAGSVNGAAPPPQPKPGPSAAPPPLPAADDGEVAEVPPDP